MHLYGEDCSLNVIEMVGAMACCHDGEYIISFDSVDILIVVGIVDYCHHVLYAASCC